MTDETNVEETESNLTARQIVGYIGTGASCYVSIKLARSLHRRFKERKAARDLNKSEAIATA